MLLLGIVQQEAELHALAGELAVGEAAEPLQHGAQAVVRVARHRGARLAALAPVADHLLRSVTTMSAAVVR